MTPFKKNTNEDQIPLISNIEAYVLSALSDGAEHYGLQMIKDSEGRLKRGTIYVTLSRMEAKGYIKSRKEKEIPPHGTVPRRQYRIDAPGEAALEKWIAFHATPIKVLA